MATANDHCKLQSQETFNFCHVETFNCLVNRVVVSESGSTADSFSPSAIGPVSKYLGTRSSAGLGATSGQTLARTCE